MAISITASSRDMRLHASEPPRETDGPKWKDNSCSMDVCVWIAKMLMVRRTRLDHDAKPKNELQAEFQGLMQDLWWKIGQKGVDARRDALRRLYNPEEGAMDSVPNLWEALTEGLPTTATQTQTFTDCCNLDCYTHLGSSTATSVFALSSAELGNRVDYENDPLSELLEQRFARYYVKTKGTFKACGRCGTRTAKHTRVIQLAPLLAVSEAAWQTVSLEKIPFEYYTVSEPEQVPQKLQATYRLRAGIIYEKFHFQAFVIWYEESGAFDYAIWYDGLGKPKTIKVLPSEALKNRWDGFRKRGGEPSMLVLERLA